MKAKVDKLKGHLVSIIMGSKSDWPTMEIASQTLHEFGVPHETKIVSAHRTPDLLFEFAKSAEDRGIEVIIAGAGGAAHLPGMCASQTVLPVLGVPVESKVLERPGFAAVHSSDAGGCTSRDTGDRAGRSEKCGFAGSFHSRKLAARTQEKTSFVSLKADENRDKIQAGEIKWKLYELKPQFK